MRSEGYPVILPEHDRTLRGYARRVARYAPCWLGWEDFYQEGCIAYLRTENVWDAWNAMQDVLRKYGRYTRGGNERVDWEHLPVSNIGVDPAKVVEILQYRRAMKKLPAVQRSILKAHHEGVTGEEMARELRYSAARVCQLRKAAEKVLAPWKVT